MLTALLAASGFPPALRASELRLGPWGAIELTPIMLFAPSDVLPGSAGSMYATTWFFPGRDAVALRGEVMTFPLNPRQRDALLDESAWVVGPDGVVITPPDAIVLSLSPEARIRIYTELARSSRNVQHQAPWSIRTNAWSDILAISGLNGDTRKRVNDLAYTIGDRRFVADLPALINAITNQEQRQIVYRVMRATVGYDVALRVSTRQERDGFFSRWGGGGRLDGLRPMVDALGRQPSGRTVDIQYVLPEFARTRLNTFPGRLDLPEGVRHDCHWTSLNFFSVRPEEAWGTKAGMEREIRDHYAPFVGEPAFGDVVYFTRPAGEIVHSAVYLAANLVFTKNGDRINQPWIIMDLDDLRSQYGIALRDDLQLHYRRKRL